VELLWQSKRFGSNGLTDSAAANALSADTNGSYFAIWKGNLAILKVWGEPSLGDTSNLRTHTAQVFGLTTNLYLIPDRRYFLTNFATLGHD